MSKNLGGAKNYGRQKGDMKQVPYWGSTSIRRHPAKGSFHGDLALGFVHPCTYIYTDIVQRQKSNILAYYKALKLYNRVHVTVNLARVAGLDFIKWQFYS
jgi:hypothetical protein